MNSISDNLKKIYEKINNACSKINKTQDDIRLVVVTKNVPVEKIIEVISLGVKDIGENRVQEAEKKIQSLLNSIPKEFTFHMIGHLQTNKVKKALALFDIIQSLDSVHLAEEIDKRAEKMNKIQPCLIELKTSHEETKFGVTPEQFDELIQKLEELKNIKIIGVMTIAPYFDNPEKTRPYFAKAREVFEKYFNVFKKHTPTPLLSMGMSNDYEIAIQEGSNMIRLGTAIFGETTYG